MRSSKSRQRSKQNRPRTLGNIINRVFESSGPESKVRGTPQQIIEKYQLLARDAQLSNDRVAAENFLQHAEHYTRLLGEAQREMAAEQEARQQQSGHYPGQNGSQNGNGNPRDQRDPARSWRDERSLDAGNDDQPDIPSVDDPRYGDAGLVETPEARRDIAVELPRREAASDQPRRDDRREDRNRRADRPEGDRPRPPAENRAPTENRTAGENRPPRSPRPQRPDHQPAARTEPATTVVPDAPVAAASPAEAASPEGDAAKPARRARAPRKPKDSGDGSPPAPREAAE